jgi:hypothetical protein
MLEVAVIGLDAGERERRGRIDAARESDHVGLAGGAGAVGADVEVDHHLERLRGPRRRGLERGEVLGRVGDHHQLGFRGVQRHQPRELRLTGRRRGDQHARNPAGDHRLGLAQGRAADAHRAGLGLSAGDGDALVALGVRPEREPGTTAMLGHARDVALHRVEVEHQRRRAQPPAAPRHPDQ